MNKKLLLILLLLVNISAVFSQLDTQHWLPPLHSRANNQIADHYVYLSTPEVTPFTVTITNGAGTVLATPTISAGNPFTYSVGTGQVPATPLFVPIDSLNQPLANCGLKLTAPEPFYANQRMRSNAQAESVTAKGTSALGTVFRVGGFPQFTDGASGDRNFVAGIMATQNNTQVTISNYDPAIIFSGSPSFSTPSITVTLQAGESYIVSGNNDIAANMDGFIGALIQSTQPIVLTNGCILGNIHPTSNSRDMGVDQSVPVSRLGQDHILIEGNGIPEMERPIVIAHFNNTQIFVNGSSTPLTTIQAGEYYLVPNASYQGSTHRNMFIRTSQPAYVYQALAGSTSQATSGLNFIPPFNCFLPHEINFIPNVDQIGATVYTGGLMVFTQQGATLQINGVTQSGAVPVSGAPWVTYKISGLTGNVTITSSAAVAAGVFGASSSAGFAGYYSGFSTNPSASDFTYADTCITSGVQFTGSYDTQVPIDSVRWNFGDPSSGAANSSGLINPLHTFSAPGTYTVRYIVYRCENDTVTRTISVVGPPTTADAGPDQTFCGTSVTFAGNTPVSGTGIWTLDSGVGTVVNPTSPTANVPDLGQGPNIFSWNISNACGTASDDVVIYNHYLPVSEIGPDLVVCDDAVFLNANPGVYGFCNWTVLSGSGTFSNPDFPATLISDLVPGTTAVLQLAVESLPCPTAYDTILVTRLIDPSVANAGPDQTVCSDAATLSANTPVNGTGSWALLSGTGVFADPFSPQTTVSGLSEGANSFLWTISNGPCDPFSDIVVVTRISPAQPANAGTDQTICATQATLSGNNPSAGTGIWSVVTGSGTFANASQFNTNVTGLGTGANVFQWTVTNSPCPATNDQVTITRAAPAPSANAGTDQQVCASQVTLAGNNAAPGIGTWTLISGSGNFSNASQANSVVTGLGTGTNVFQWTIANSPCPSTSDQVTVTISDPTLITGNISPDYCDQGNGIATVQSSGTSGNVNFVWTPGNLPGATQTGLDAGVYSVTITDANNCTAQIDVTIPAAPGQQVEAGSDISVCDGSAVTLNATGSSLYQWNPDVPNGTPFIPVQPGKYIVTATDIHGCVSQDSLFITLIPGPLADLTTDQDTVYVNSEVVFTNLSMNGTSFQWDFGNGMESTEILTNDVSSSYMIPGGYVIQLTASDQQCSDQASLLLIVLPYPDPVVEFPNVFTPNGDKVNDVFTPKCEFCSEIEITIVNRWGETVGELGGSVYEWNGEDYSDGVYFYRYTLTGLNGKEVSGHGNFTLLRGK